MNFINACLCTLLANFEWWRRRQGGVWFKVKRYHVDDPVVWGPIECVIWTQEPETGDEILAATLYTLSPSVNNSNRSVV